jgi:serine/threonine-protein kinase
MPDDPRIRPLLEEILESHLTPEEVCAGSPELLPELRVRWKQLQAVMSEIQALFPPSDRASGN